MHAQKREKKICVCFMLLMLYDIDSFHFYWRNECRDIIVDIIPRARFFLKLKFTFVRALSPALVCVYMCAFKVLKFMRLLLQLSCPVNVMSLSILKFSHLLMWLSLYVYVFKVRRFYFSSFFLYDHSTEMWEVSLTFLPDSVFSVISSFIATKSLRLFHLVLINKM